MEKLLKPKDRVNDGKTIIANHKNRYCTPKRVEKRMNEISLQEAEVRFHLENIAKDDLYGAYDFFTTEGLKTVPTRKITLYVRKRDRNR